METTQKIVEFKAKIARIYNEKAVTILKYQKPLYITSFRVNLVKSSIENCLDELKKYNLSITKGPFANSFYIPVEQKYELVRSTPYLQGNLYVQEFSSMIPPLLFNFEENNKIADLCASPGSKTSQISVLCPTCEILAVEKAKIRLFKLKHNLNLLGVKNVEYLYDNSIFLPKKYPQFVNYFDKVLVDAPCSTESKLFPEEEKSFEYWSPKKVNDFARTQKGLLMAGINMLETGGELIYSTCTYSVEENEMVLDYVLKKFDNLKIEKIDLDIPNQINGFTSYSGKELDKQISKSIRILPNEMFSGFFVAKLRKS